MNRTRGRLLITACAVLLLFSISLNAGAQEPAALATTQLEDVRLRGQDLRSLLSDLALQYDIPIGFERAMNSNDLTEVRMKFNQITLGDLLTRILAEHKAYAWEIRDGIVYIFPKNGYRDPIVEQLLNVRLKTFSLKKSTVTWDVETTLLKTPEFAEVFDAYGLTTLGWTFSGFYFPHLGKNYTLDVSDITVQSMLNRIVKESPTAKFWSVSRDSSEHVFSLNLAALQEGTPKNFRRIDFEELDLLSYPIP
ncbi:MAG TPA: hypothetical protein VJS13_03395 [Pyrinomonadaceae bacterium]|nr:hypothetical protein [Pyrinomonadaceae bacterium]